MFSRVCQKTVNGQTPETIDDDGPTRQYYYDRGQGELVIMEGTKYDSEGGYGCFKVRISPHAHPQLMRTSE